MDLETFQKEVGEWGQSTFPEATPQSIASHLMEEATEFALECGVDVRSWVGDRQMAERLYLSDQEAADVFLLLLHHCHRRNVSLADLARAKFEVVKTRTYAKSSKGYWKHVEETDDPS